MEKQITKMDKILEQRKITLTEVGGRFEAATIDVWDIVGIRISDDYYTEVEFMQKEGNTYVHKKIEVYNSMCDLMGLIAMKRKPV